MLRTGSIDEDQDGEEALDVIVAEDAHMFQTFFYFRGVGLKFRVIHLHELFEAGQNGLGFRRRGGEVP